MMKYLILLGVLFASQTAFSKNVVCLLNEADTQVNWSVRHKNDFGDSKLVPSKGGWRCITLKENYAKINLNVHVNNKQMQWGDQCELEVSSNKWIHVTGDGENIDCKVFDEENKENGLLADNSNTAKRFVQVINFYNSYSSDVKLEYNGQIVGSEQMRENSYTFEIDEPIQYSLVATSGEPNSRSFLKFDTRNSKLSEKAIPLSPYSTIYSAMINRRISHVTAISTLKRGLNAERFGDDELFVHVMLPNMLGVDTDKLIDDIFSKGVDKYVTENFDKMNESGFFAKKYPLTRSFRKRIQFKSQEDSNLEMILDKRIKAYQDNSEMSGPVRELINTLVIGTPSTDISFSSFYGRDKTNQMAIGDYKKRLSPAKSAVETIMFALIGVTSNRALNPSKRSEEVHNFHMQRLKTVENNMTYDAIKQLAEAAKASDIKSIPEKFIMSNINLDTQGKYLTSRELAEIRSSLVDTLSYLRYLIFLSYTRSDTSHNGVSTIIDEIYRLLSEVQKLEVVVTPAFSPFFKDNYEMFESIEDGEKLLMKSDDGKAFLVSKTLAVASRREEMIKGPYVDFNFFDKAISDLTKYNKITTKQLFNERLGLVVGDYRYPMYGASKSYGIPRKYWSFNFEDGSDDWTQKTHALEKDFNKWVDDHGNVFSFLYGNEIKPKK